MTTPEKEAKLRQTYSVMSNAELEEILDRGLPRPARLVLKTVIQERTDARVDKQTEIMREANDWAKKGYRASKVAIGIALVVLVVSLVSAVFAALYGEVNLLYYHHDFVDWSSCCAGERVLL